MEMYEKFVIVLNFEAAAKFFSSRAKGARERPFPVFTFEIQAVVSPALVFDLFSDRALLFTIRFVSTV